MQANVIKPRKALNAAWLKVKPIRSEIETFKANLIHLIHSIDNARDEEYHKTEVRDFLRNTYYKDHYHFNVKHNIDWAIFNGPKSSDSVGVLIETKKPANKSEMLTRENLNKKAFHELILYYLRERITHKNLEIKHIVATNIYEWFIFDAAVFDRLFAQSKSLVRQFTDFEEGRLAGKTTDFFYREIAEPFVAQILTKIEYTWFDIRDYEKPLKNQDKRDDNQLIVLYKILSPEHLLKLRFVNDSNSLDKAFYAELLHLIGLSETKEGNKKVIGRKPEGKRDDGSLLENAIVQLDSMDKISRMAQPSQYGASYQERLFNVALELVITWANRILFLKLLEAQLVSYHHNDPSFSFLNFKKVRNYDDLNSLFFSVLARTPENRIDNVKARFAHVPYLNSSLFELSDIEAQTIVISNLGDEVTLPLLSATVLKDNSGKRRTGAMNALEYFFEFLEAYDFSSEGSEEIQEDNKSLINASVLGLIFEKINGYKDGSFFTPGFITMYMCREAIRRAVVERFREAGYQLSKSSELLESFNELYNQITDKKQANQIINSLKICDPAVGSGHFLVSALNEIIAIKSELKILMDRTGRTLRDYHIQVENDELAIRDDDGNLFKYSPESPESQRVQEALFHEKQIIIENCLFGVDINPNSVKICRLRLWIELLKHAYYVQEDTLKVKSPVCYAESAELREGYELPVIGQLQTLPNIDINIKCGNSLISRFELDADISQALKKSKWTIDSYRTAVQTYREASNKEEKREMERLIADIKKDFETEISKNDKRLTRLNKIKGELFNLTNQQSLFGLSDAEKKAWEKQVEKLTKDAQKLEAEIEEIKSNKIYENAFEWRFEFPEVLDEEGNFVGFDVVIGNPPYIRQEEFSSSKPYLQSQYETYAGTADLFVYFVERGLKIAQSGAQFVYILPNKWMRAGYGLNLRKWIKNHEIISIVDFGDLPVFEEATTYPCLWFIRKQPAKTGLFASAQISTLQFPNGLDRHVSENIVEVDQNLLPDSGWTLVDDKVQKLLEKIKNAGVPLGEYVKGKIFRGVLTGLNEAFVIDAATRERLIREDPKCEEIIKPFLAGRDIKRYQQPKSDKYLILLKNGQTKEMFGELSEEMAWEKLSEKYSSICSYLLSFESKAKKRYDQGQYWWELRAYDHYREFESRKIMYPDISKNLNFTIDEDKHYCVNTVYNIATRAEALLGYLNSQLFLFYFSSVSNSIRGGYMRFFSDYMLLCPVPKDLGSIETTVNKVLLLKKQNPDADTSQLEAEIDRMVYELYGLTEEEIALVENR